MVYRKKILKQYIHTVKRKTQGSNETVTRNEELFGVNSLVRGLVTGLDEDEGREAQEDE